MRRSLRSQFGEAAIAFSGSHEAPDLVMSQASSARRGKGFLMRCRGSPELYISGAVRGSWVGWLGGP